MKGHFTVKGKYKSGFTVLEVSKEDVDNRRVFDVDPKNAQNYIKVGKFGMLGTKIPEKKQPSNIDFEKHTRDDLMKMLDEKGIEYDKAMKKEQLIALFK